MYIARPVNVKLYLLYLIVGSYISYATKVTDTDSVCVCVRVGA